MDHSSNGLECVIASVATEITVATAYDVTGMLLL
jgi:hypothetical protein